MFLLLPLVSSRMMLNAALLIALVVSLATWWSATDWGIRLWSSWLWASWLWWGGCLGLLGFGLERVLASVFGAVGVELYVRVGR